MLRPYVIKNVSGIKVAVIGIVTEDTPVTTHPKNIYGLKFNSVEDTVRKYINDLKDTVDVIVVLSHIGHNLDRLLAEKVKGIDIIIGGHSHTKIVTPVLIGKTIILQAWEHGKALGVLDLYLEDGKIVKAEGRLIEIRPSAGSEDKAAKAIVDKYCQKIDSLMDDKIGETEVNLDGENARIRETNLGNFIADIIRNTAGAEVAIIGGGSIRTGIKKGDIRVRDIYSVSPFNNYIVAIKLTGRQIKKALEHGLSSIEEREGSFPQVSGLRFIYSRSEPAGYKIGEILIAGRRIENDKEYVVATNDFLAAGGDGYKVFAEALEPLEDPAASGGLIKGEKLVYSNSGRWLRDIIIEHIRERGKIAPYADGRIIETR
jgi:2',3'-cyclic-nucleotide 2'-phosphodiesterase (5'-nucleotidase family)